MRNAWPVNFSLPLTAFTLSIEGDVNLVQFAVKSQVNNSLQFYSSIASVFNHPNPEVPEAIDDDLLSSLLWRLWAIEIRRRALCRPGLQNVERQRQRRALWSIRRYRTNCQRMEPTRMATESDHHFDVL